MPFLLCNGAKNNGLFNDCHGPKEKKSNCVEDEIAVILCTEEFSAHAKFPEGSDACVPK